MKIKILATDGLAQEGVELLKTHPNIQLDLRISTSASELSGLIAEYDALIVRTPTQVTAEALALASRLKLVVCSGAGYDNVNVQAASAKNIAVMNCPTANSLSAAEQTLGLFFALARHIPQSSGALKSGSWDRSERFYGTELHGKILGVVGLGNVGKIVAEKAMGLGMLVLGYDTAISSIRQLPEKFKYLEQRFKLCDGMDELLTESDWITMHIPKEERNIDLFNAETIAKMRPGSYLVNVSRGGIVNEKALLSALRSGHLRGAASDVFTSEPPNFSDETIRELLAHPAFIGTAHLGGATLECRERIASTVAKQILAFFNEGARSMIVN